MQYCERDCEEDEFEGHFPFFFLFPFFENDCGSCWAEGAVVFGEKEEEDLGLRCIGDGNGEGGENGG